VQFEGDEQNDAHEFLSCLLMGLNEDLNTATSKDSSAITELFQLMIVERVKCLTCNKIKERQEA